MGYMNSIFRMTKQVCKITNKTVTLITNFQRQIYKMIKAQLTAGNAFAPFTFFPCVTHAVIPIKAVTAYNIQRLNRYHTTYNDNS